MAYSKAISRASRDIRDDGTVSVGGSKRGILVQLRCLRDGASISHRTRQMLSTKGRADVTAQRL